MSCEEHMCVQDESASMKSHNSAHKYEKSAFVQEDSAAESSTAEESENDEVFTMSDSFEDSTDNDVSEYGVKITDCRSRRNGNSKTTVSDLIKRKRLRANDRERRRIQSINVAMNALKKAIPITQSKQKITKLKLLNIAQDYIRALSEALRTDTPLSYDVIIS